MPRRDESAMQKAVIKWWGYSHTGLGVRDERLLYANANGGARPKATGANLKLEGVRAGVPDLFLSVPRYGRHGLYIEMKKWGGVASVDQLELQALFRNEGYEVVQCQGVDQAQRAIKAYLKGKEISL